MFESGFHLILSSDSVPFARQSWKLGVQHALPLQLPCLLLFLALLLAFSEAVSPYVFEGHSYMLACDWQHQHICIVIVSHGECNFDTFLLLQGVR